MKTTNIFIDEFFSQPPKNNNPTNKTDVYQIDDIWSFDILGLNYYGPENYRGYRYVSVAVDNFSNFVWTVPLKNKIAQTITNSFEKTLQKLQKDNQN